MIQYWKHLAGNLVLKTGRPIRKFPSPERCGCAAKFNLRVNCTCAVVIEPLMVLSSCH
jgi:hypothetical protein